MGLENWTRASSSQLSLQSLIIFFLPRAHPPCGSLVFLLWQQMKQLLSQLWVSGSQMTFSLCRLSASLCPKVDTMDPLMALLCLLPLYPGRSRGEGCWSPVEKACTAHLGFPLVNANFSGFSVLIFSPLLCCVSCSQAWLQPLPPALRT